MKRLPALHAFSGLAMVAALMAPGASRAYERYAGGCDGGGCHGNFLGSTSPKGSVFPGGDKHQMHRAAAEMDTDCLLCHTSTGDNPRIGSSGAAPFLGCMGCHGREEDAGNDSLSPGLGAGLRQHHYNAGETGCAVCHSDANPANYTPVGEDVFPAYYGTAVPKVDDPCNGTAADQTNENWTNENPLEFIGLDNDGDGLYDVADPDCNSCGNGVIDAGETCDDGPGSPTPCPADCADLDPCTADGMTGDPATCDVICTNDPIGECLDADGCCPGACDVSNDSDCLGTCGDGFCTGDETKCSCSNDCTADVCGDGCCTGTEDNAGCPGDCPACDGDGICEGEETICTCPLDNCSVFPGDGCCSAGENACSAPVDCAESCGDDCCSASEDCASCADDCACTAPAMCLGGECVACGNGTCDTGVGEDCESCADDCACDAPLACIAGACVGCGDETCEGTVDENCSNCTADCDCGAGNYCDTDANPPVCASECGDGICEGTADENCSNCADDCECEAGEYCDTVASPPSCASLCGDGACDGDEDCESCSEDCGTCGEPGTDMGSQDGDTTGDGGTGGDGGSPGVEGDEGCSCQVGAGARGGVGPIAALLALTAWRRRRRAARP